MAGETQKTTRLSNRRSNGLPEARLAKGRPYIAADSHQFAAATELEAADNLLMDIVLPSNAIVHSIEHINDDCDTHACAPTLVIDVGLAADADYTDVTSGTETKHSRDDIIDADLFVDGNTALRAATTAWTEFASPDATTFGPEDRLKQIWELLGYDEDPGTNFVLCVQSQAAAAALGAAADLAVRVTYTVD